MANVARTREKTIALVRKSYHKHKTVPTIDEMARKLRISPRQLYAAFPDGLQEICQEARVPTPVQRLSATRPALKQRERRDSIPFNEQSNTAEDPKPDSGEINNVEVVDPDLAPLMRELDESRARIAKKKKKVELLKLSNKLTNEEKTLDRQFHIKEREEQARLMLSNYDDYEKGMIDHLQKRPAIAQELHKHLAQLGRGLDFDRNVANMLRKRFEIAHDVATQFPEVMRNLGFLDQEYPISSNLAEEEWRTILEDLRTELSAHEYANLKTRLSMMGPVICPYDGTRLRHVGGAAFVCSRSHLLAVHCPQCGGELVSDGSQFECPRCLLQLLQA